MGFCTQSEFQGGKFFLWREISGVTFQSEILHWGYLIFCYNSLIKTAQTQGPLNLNEKYFLKDLSVKSEAAEGAASLIHEIIPVCLNV